MSTLTAAPPDYDPLQRAFHRAFEPELTEVIEGLPLTPGCRVLDVPCGDGFFTRRLARRVGGTGRIVGIDRDGAYLQRARRDTEGGAVSFQEGDAYALPCGDAEFDLALSAMSFISIADPVRALRELRRVLVPGGTVAVLESDEYHHVLLPWPVDLEVALLRAIRDGCRRKYGRASRYSPARRVNRMLREAGFEPLRKSTRAADRQAPFSDEVAEFLRLHLDFLRELVQPHLTEEQLRRLNRFADGTRVGSLFRRIDAEVTCLTTLHLARRPA